jgi:GlpG protein
MRTIGNLDDEQAAARFGDFLTVRGIDNQVEDEDDGTFSIWILEERQMATATELLRQFRANPQSEEFLAAPRLALLRRAEQEREELQRRSTVMDSARVNYERSAGGVPWLTLFLILICVGVGIYSGLANENQLTRFLHISEFVSDKTTGIFFNFFTKTIAPSGVWLSEVRQGQIWRLVTPIFLHFNVLHLLFNMMMLREFGSFIERRFGSAQLGLLVLGTAVLSNLGQMLWVGPNFGGMSGVDYGLLGFLWIRGKYDPRAGFELNPSSVKMMLIWLVLCYTGLMGSIANMAHTVGLLTGMAWGYYTARRS